MHRSVLEDEDFIAWANENVVVLVGNGNGTGTHKTGAKDDDAKGGKKDDDKKGIPRPEGEEPDAKPEEGDSKPEEPTAGPAADVDCTYYPGLKCAEHVKALQDVRKPPEGVPEIPEWKGIPATFLVGPEGTVEECNEDRAPSSLQNAVEDLQKRLKLKTVSFKKYEGYLKAMADGDAAVEAGKWKAALAAYAKVDKDAKKLPGLTVRLGKRLEAMNAKVLEAFGKAKEEADAAARLKAVKALRAEAGAKLASAGALPVVADLDAWIKENAAPAK
jgi:hypothetical protein